MAIPQSTQTTDYLTVRKGLTINGTMTLGDAAADTLTVNGAATFASTVQITGASTYTGAMDVNGAMDIDGAVDVGTSATNAAGLTVTSADGVNTQAGLVIDNNETNGVATGLKIDLASTGTANAFEVTAVATNAGPIVTDGVTTDCAIDQVGAAIRITNGTTTYYLPCLTTFA